MQNEKTIDIFLKFHVWDFLSEDPSRETFFDLFLSEMR